MSNIWRRYKDKDLESHRENCGRKEKLSEKTKERILEAIEDDHTLTVEEIAEDEDLNPEGACANTISNLLH